MQYNEHMHMGFQHSVIWLLPLVAYTLLQMRPRLVADSAQLTALRYKEFLERWVKFLVWPVLGPADWLL